MTLAQIEEDVLLGEVPSQVNDAEILDYLYTRDVNWRHVNAIKSITNFSDENVSEWLNLSIRTLRDYRKPDSEFKDNVKEHVLLLLALMKHGIHVLGSQKAFDSWLSTPNFFFDKKSPETLLNKITGIRLIDDRLTAMEYGDNV